MRARRPVLTFCSKNCSTLDICAGSCDHSLPLDAIVDPRHSYRRRPTCSVIIELGIGPPRRLETHSHSRRHGGHDVVAVLRAGDVSIVQALPLPLPPCANIVLSFSSPCQSATVDVKLEDQQKINAFSRLNTKMHELEAQLAAKKVTGACVSDNGSSSQLWGALGRRSSYRVVLAISGPPGLEESAGPLPQHVTTCVVRRLHLPDTLPPCAHLPSLTQHISLRPRIWMRLATR